MKKYVIYITVENYSALKRKGIQTQAITRMNPEDVLLSEIHQTDTQKDKYCTIWLI